MIGDLILVGDSTGAAHGWVADFLLRPSFFVVNHFYKLSSSEMATNTAAARSTRRGRRR